MGWLPRRRPPVPIRDRPPLGPDPCAGLTRARPDLAPEDDGQPEQGLPRSDARYLQPPRKPWYTRAAHWIQAVDLDPETAFRKKRPPPAPRTIYFNEPLPDDAFHGKKRTPKPEWVYATNQVLTAKYTIYNFVFKNLLEQFRRVANLFFLRASPT